MLRRPAVLCAVIAFIQTSICLAFPEAFLPLFILSLILCGISFPVCAKTKNYIILLMIIPSLLFSVIIPHHMYTKYEKSSLSLVERLREKENRQYTAVVTECRSYSSYSQIFAEITAVEDTPLPSPLNARLGCYSGYSLSVGDTFIFEGTPTSVYETQNDNFDTTSYLRSKMVFADFPSVSIISSFPSEKASFLQSLREYTKNVIYRYIPQNYNYETASVCHAMFAGDRNHIPKDIKNDFSKCGLTHILCVSGMHLAILAGTLYSIMSMLTLHKKTRCIAVIILCIFYTAFTGFSLSTIRSCIMCIFGYLGMMWGRKTDGYISLFFSLLAIILFSPYSVLDISLILSFCATLGIICTSEMLTPCKSEKNFVKGLYAVLSALVSNLGAVIFTLPVCAFFFGGISLLSIVSTLTVSTVFEILLTFILFLMLISPLSEITFFDTALQFIGKACDTLCQSIVDTAHFFSGFKFARITSVFPKIFMLLFVISVIILSVFIAFEKVSARKTCICAIIALGITFSFLSLITAIIDDGVYKVSYYRKNEDDREVCIKLKQNGFLLVNADSSLCSDKNDIPFDYLEQDIYLLIVPDEAVNPYILSESIKLFSSRFNLDKILISDTDEGKVLAESLSEYGVDCSYMPKIANFGKLEITCNDTDFFSLTVNDGKTKTNIVYGDSYDSTYFDKDSDICAYFTRKTKNQFNTEKDSLPECSVFYTRLKKDEVHKKTVNTFGQKNVIIKG